MRRKPKLKYVKFQFTKGNLYAYFNTGKKNNGKLIWAKLPPYDSVGFFDSYAKMLGHRNRKNEDAAFTVKDLIHRYEASDEFKVLKPNSKRSYRSIFDKVITHFGNFPLDDVTPSRIREVLKVMPGNGTRNLLLSVIGVLYRTARIDELTQADPTKDIPRYKMGEHEPWPQELLDVALTCDDDRVRLAVHLLYYTGQRIGDVCKMRWTKIRGNRISVRQEKTDKLLSIFLHSDLAAEMARMPKEGMTIIAGQNGKPLAVRTLRENIQDFASELGYKIVPHGLRKNAVISLLEVECTIAQVSAVTGQSMQMVEHYAKRVNQEALGDAAILKLERSRNFQT